MIAGVEPNIADGAVASSSAVAPSPKLTSRRERATLRPSRAQRTAVAPVEVRRVAVDSTRRPRPPASATTTLRHGSVAVPTQRAAPSARSRRGAVQPLKKVQRKPRSKAGYSRPRSGVFKSKELYKGIIASPTRTIQCVSEDGSLECIYHAVLHNPVGPAAVFKSGEQRWYKHGVLHRDDGPAHILPNGSMFYYVDGKFHREDGPAGIHASGTEEWYIHGERHRDDGPAVYGGGVEEQVWVRGVQVIEEVEDVDVSEELQ
jgi:hypothetical protein